MTHDEILKRLRSKGIEPTDLPRRLGNRLLVQVYTPSAYHTYVTASGKPAFKRHFSDVSYFVDINGRHVAAANQVSKGYHIDEWGHKVYRGPTFIKVGDFDEVEPGLFLAPVRDIGVVGDKYLREYHINITGKAHYAERFERVHPFRTFRTAGRVAEVHRGGEFFHINTKGQRV